MRAAGAWKTALVMLFLVAGGAGIARGAPPTREDCLTCHAQHDFARGAHGGSLYVDAAELSASPHAPLECVSCHSDAQTIPHASRLAAVRCQSCHAGEGRTLAGSVHRNAGTEGEAASADGSPSCTACHGTHAVRRATRMGPESCAACHAPIVRAYQASVHGVALAHGDTDASRCRDCHGPAHAVLSHRDTASTVSHAKLAETCARCHADQELMTRRQITIPAAYTLYKESVHGRSKNPAAATCNDCHASHDLRRASDPSSSIFRANIPATCGRCHANEAREYGESVHGTAMARGVLRSPVCTDCHGEHRIQGPREAGSPVASTGVTATCSHCHEAAGIRETYGLPAGRLSSYRDSYHGLAARGGAPAVANCASCHGYHRILPSSDPRSAIAPANLPATCGKCHPGAGERFARGAVHEAMAAPSRPVLRSVRLVYLALIGLTVGGMFVHNGLDFLGKARSRLRAQLGAAGSAAAHAVAATDQWIVRMTLGERLQHVALAASFFTLVYTGFALKFPEAWPFAWLARLEGGHAWRSLIHRGAAVVMVATALSHLVSLFGRRGRTMLGAMLPELKDFRDVIGNALYLTGLRAYPPRFEHFSYIEKVEYWALVWGTAVMTVTGGLLWFENAALHWLDKWVLDLATIVHYYEAWLAFLAILVWHIYQTVLNPDVYPMNWTWLTGRISDAQLRHEHRAEWDRLEAASRPAGTEEAPGSE